MFRLGNTKITRKKLVVLLIFGLILGLTIYFFYSPANVEPQSEGTPEYKETSDALAKYGSLYFLLFSLLQNHGFSFANLSFWKTILGITGAEMTGALPIKGIAGFGTWASGWALTFQLMDFEQRIAILSGIGVHLISNIFEYSLGILSIIILTLPFLNRKN